MADFTAFLSKLLVAWPDDVDDYQFAHTLVDKNGLDTVITSMSYYMTQSMSLDLNETITVTWPTTGVATLLMNKVIWARVIGSALITAAGTDPNSSAGTTTYLEAQGIDIWPGIIFLNTIGLANTFTVKGLAAGTTVELFTGII